LLTLVGPAGAGKTRLALELSRRATPTGSAVPVALLAAVRDGRGVGRAIALSFGVATERDPIDALIEWLGDREATLVLDNCDHLIVESGATATRMLAACAGLRIIATSRAALAIEGEQVLPLSGLSLPIDRSKWRRSEAVRLFAERARAADPTFSVDASNSDVVVEICHRLDGIPLAIELAARRVRGMRLDEIRRGLDDALVLLDGSAGRGAAHQHTMASAIDWSHRLLGEPERRVLRRLSVLSSSFTSDLAVQVCADDETGPERVGRALAQLVEHSLVQVSGGSAGRYWLLEVIRQYARARLDQAGELARVEARRAAWIVRLFAEFDPREARPLEKLMRIIAEHEHVRAAMSWLVVRDPATARRALAKVWLVYVFLRPGIDPAEIERWLVQALEAEPARDETRARMLIGLAQRRFARGDHDGSIAAAEEARVVAEERGDDHARGGAHHRLAIARLASGDAAGALAAFTSAVEFYDRASVAAPNLRGASAWALAQRSQARAALGDAAGAREDLERALATMRSRPHHERVYAIIRVLSGRQALRDGRHDDARSDFEETLRAFKRVGAEIPVAHALRGLAEIAAHRRQPDRALRLLGAAEEISARTGDTWAASHTTDPLAALQQQRTRRATLARAAGRRMSVTEAVNYALQEIKPSVEALSPRELEVVALIGQGLTSRDIAAQLGIAERTAENHVENILGKLGLRSRAQIVRWALTSGAEPGGVKAHD
jgi:predicted ATPase/DNA-binding CsgD family transcriptional regulator